MINSSGLNFLKSKPIHFFKQIQIGFLVLTLIAFVSIGKLMAQTLPAATSCTSKDLELKSVKLAYTGLCFPYGQPTNVILEITNKTGSVRTSFACWAKLVRTTKNGIEQAPVSVFICGGPIQPSSVTSIVTSETITVNEGESIVLKDLFLAWTTSNANQTCDFLKNNSATINPKCGVLPSIAVQAGVAGKLTQTPSVCGGGGSVTSVNIAPYGGTAPYKVSIDGGSEINVAASSSYTFPNVDASIGHTITIKDKNGCVNSANTVVSTVAPVVANAGDDFTKNCLINVDGKSIGEPSASGFSYAWSPSAGLSSTSISNPTANPLTTTTYVVSKTNTATGCSSTDQVTVIVNNATVTAFAGAGFTKNCLVNITGNSIGESSASGFTYSWSPSIGLNDPSIANPTANPASNQTYTVTKTNTQSGCFGTSQVTVTVDNSPVTANAGADFTKTCVAKINGDLIGETSASGFTYAWSTAEGLSDGATANPIANPTTTTTYTLTKTKESSGCFGIDDVTVTVNNTKPTFSVALVQPTVSLCAALTLGSVSFCATGGSNLEYSIDNGNTYVSNSILSNLASGSVSGYKVRNSYGCVTTATCENVTNCPTPSLAASPVNALVEGSVVVKSMEPALSEARPTVKAYPNPFNGQVNFNIQTPTAGKSVLEVFDAVGRKIGIAFQGNMNAGEIKTIQYNVPGNYSGTLIYRLSVGEKMTNGKIISTAKKIQNRP